MSGSGAAKRQKLAGEYKDEDGLHIERRFILSAWGIAALSRQHYQHALSVWADDDKTLKVGEVAALNTPHATRLKAGVVPVGRTYSLNINLALAYGSAAPIDDIRIPFDTKADALRASEYFYKIWRGLNSPHSYLDLASRLVSLASCLKKWGKSTDPFEALFSFNGVYEVATRRLLAYDVLQQTPLFFVPLSAGAPRLDDPFVDLSELPPLPRGKDADEYLGDVLDSVAEPLSPVAAPDWDVARTVPSNIPAAPLRARASALLKVSSPSVSHSPKSRGLTDEQLNRVYECVELLKTHIEQKVSLKFVQARVSRVAVRHPKSGPLLSICYESTSSVRNTLVKIHPASMEVAQTCVDGLSDRLTKGGDVFRSDVLSECIDKGVIDPNQINGVFAGPVKHFYSPNLCFKSKIYKSGSWGGRVQCVIRLKVAHGSKDFCINVRSKIAAQSLANYLRQQWVEKGIPHSYLEFAARLAAFLNLSSKNARKKKPFDVCDPSFDAECKAMEVRLMKLDREAKIFDTPIMKLGEAKQPTPGALAAVLPVEIHAPAAVSRVTNAGAGLPPPPLPAAPFCDTFVDASHSVPRSAGDAIKKGF